MKKLLAIVLSVIIMCTALSGCASLAVMPADSLGGVYDDVFDLFEDFGFPNLFGWLEDLLSAFAPKSDEELIYERIDAFLDAYNSGDMDGVLECMDSKMRNMTSGMLNIGGSILGDITGFDMDISDLFGISMGILGDGDVLTAKNIEITEIDDDRAEVSLTLIFDADIDKMEAASQSVVLVMKKEDSDWFISGMKER